jgi:hypothetical protein
LLARLALGLAFLTSAVCAADVSESLLVDPTKPIEICGIKAASLTEIPTAVIARGGVREASVNETFVAYEALDFTRIWTFTKFAHPAHPAAICRNLAEGPDGLSVDMHVFCGGAVTSCEKLTRDFEALKNEMKARVRGKTHN